MDNERTRAPLNENEKQCVVKWMNEWINQVNVQIEAYPSHDVFRLRGQRQRIKHGQGNENHELGVGGHQSRWLLKRPHQQQSGAFGSFCRAVCVCGAKWVSSRFLNTSTHWLSHIESQTGRTGMGVSKTATYGSGEQRQRRTLLYVNTPSHHITLINFIQIINVFLSKSDLSVSTV